GLLGVRGICIWWAEHLQCRAVETVDGLLCHLLLCLGAMRQFVEDLPALTLVEGLFLTDTHHGAAIRCIRSAAQWNLVNNRSTINQPADCADISPSARRVVEDGGVLSGAIEKLLHHLIAGGAQGFCRGVQVQAVAGFVLDLRHQNGLALERGRAGNPIGFRLHTDDFGVSVLGYLTHQGLSVGRWHPVGGFDAGVGGDEFIEKLLSGGVVFANRAKGASSGCHGGNLPLKSSLLTDWLVSIWPNVMYVNI